MGVHSYLRNIFILGGAPPYSLLVPPALRSNDKLRIHSAGAFLKNGMTCCPVEKSRTRYENVINVNFESRIFRFVTIAQIFARSTKNNLIFSL
jgi:hypothetical protein